MQCIVHLDMDCFYAQVEAVRLGIDCRTEPYILSQWGNLIAVNYPARNYGIARFNTVEEAREKCPQVKVSHVATYAVGDTEYGYHAHPRKGTHKVALEPYREASRRIFDILRSFEGVGVEISSIDEAYLDVTAAAQQELVSAGLPRTPRPPSLEDILHPATNLITDRQAEIDAWLHTRGKKFHDVFDTALHPPATVEHQLLLGAASRVVWNMRQRIYQELHYESSAGIAHNKILAKTISSRHKPNQQTLLLPDRVASAMWDIPCGCIRGFGGKFGDAVCRACGGAELCRDAWLIPLQALQAVLGNDEGAYAFQRLRCYDKEAIRERSVAKTLMASKSFSPPTSSAVGLRKWVTVLASELCTRYKEFCATNNVTGHTFNVKLGNRGLSQLGGVTDKTLALPEPVTTETLIVATMKIVTTTFCSCAGALINAVTLTIGSFKQVSVGEGKRRGRQMMLTAFLSCKGTEKRRRSDCNEATVITLSSASSSSEVFVETESCGQEVVIID
ncbi:putative DNA polymerase eta [Trypanosoma rangeli]|uniref:DNA polymerase eta n=1 Tax=Trypanosoma rangeli TaxID=5698 RepID=A0A3R7NDG4_TRYRA|nr:putative DNA polymerase eta [Trypanosoma rangeli]RNF04827.1 putative DNA polymerase eta [Trypanosoma rangeli]|eukprot:RNF04827.1 putative DNA polymerase eta [Trypanosoma rangeli]